MDARQARGTGRGVSPRLRWASDGAWRLLLLGGTAYIVFLILLRFELIAVALFTALIIASLPRPPVNLPSRFLPRALAAVTTAIGCLGLSGAVFWQVGMSAAGQWSRLGSKFSGGWDRIERWLEGVVEGLIPVATAWRVRRRRAGQGRPVRVGLPWGSGCRLRSR